MSQSKKLLLGLAVIGSTVWATSCDPLAGMVKLAKDQKMTTDPNPLELHGNDVPFKMTAVLPVSMMKKGTVYEMEVYYRPGDIDTQKDGDVNADELKVATTSGSMKFNGDEYAGKTTAPSKEATFNFKYNPKYEMGGLWIKGVVSTPKNGKSKKFPSEDGKQAVRARDTKMTYVRGIVTTSLMVKSPIEEPYDGKGDSPFAYALPEYNVTDATQDVRLDYEKGNSNVNNTYGVVVKNKEQMEVIDLFIKGKVAPFKAVGVSSHSPEGSEAINSGLSPNRAKDLVTQFVAKMDLYKYDKKMYPDYQKGITIDPKVLDATWPEFKQLVDQSSLTADQKTEVKKIVDGKGSFTEKEMMFAKLPYYSKLETEVYPKMRYAKVVITKAGSKKTDTEIAAVYEKIVKGTDGMTAKSLSEPEWLVLAQNTMDRKQRADVLMAAMKEYPTWKVSNNLGATYLDWLAMSSAKSDKDMYAGKAKEALTTSVAKQETAENCYNMAMIYFYEKNLDKAQEFLKKAIAKGAGANTKLQGLLYGAQAYIDIKSATNFNDGKYDSALANIAKSGDSYVNRFNKSLAEHLKRDNASAATDITAAIGKNAKDGAADYLAAIVAMKNNKLDDMAKYLVSAFSKNSDLKAKAAKDPAFASVKTGTQFMGALK